MKVQMYFNFKKKKLEKNKISKLHVECKIAPSQVYGQCSKNRRRNSQRAILKPLYSCCPPFGLMWSTLAEWLQHLPTLPIFLLKFSNAHNF
jgi:hypothetical protein